MLFMNNKEDNKSNKVFMALLIVVAFLIGGSLGFYFFYDQSVKKEIPSIIEEDEEKSEIITENKPYLLTDDQPAGDYVLVKKANFLEPGWLVAYDGPIGEARHILGAQFLPIGEHEDIIIWLQRGTVAGNSYLVAIHDDDGYILETEYGRHHFDYQIDLPIKNFKGDFIFDVFETESLGSRG